MPKWAMKLDIQLHLSGLSLAKTAAILDNFGIERDRLTTPYWVHNADL